jgi:protein-tyrosine-phosphatase
MTEDMSYAEDTIRVGSKKRGRKPKKQKSVVAEEGIQATKEYANYLKTHDIEQADAFLVKTNEELKKAAVYCLVEISEEIEQVETNENYKKAKEDIKAFKGALKDAIKPLQDTIALATILLKERGDTLNPDSAEAAVAQLKQFGVEFSVQKS